MMPKTILVPILIAGLAVAAAYARLGRLPVLAAWATTLAQSTPAGLPARGMPSGQTQPQGPQAPQTAQPAEGSGPTSQGMQTFSGSVIQLKGGYYLRVGDLAYKLDDQDKARQFDGKNVRVQGTLDKQTNTLHLQTIEAAPSM